jgi:hypothetical protein
MSNNTMVKFCSWVALLTLSAAACSTFDLDSEDTATPASAASGRAVIVTPGIAPNTPPPGTADSRPTPTSVLDGRHLSYTDPFLGLSLDIPFWWDTHGSPGAVAQFLQQGHTGAQKTVLTVSVLNPESISLESALDEVVSGAWGPYISDVQTVELGAFTALRLELIPGADRPPLAWLLVAPSGRAVGIKPDVDPALIEPLIQVVLDTLRPVDVSTPPAARITSVPPTRTPWLTPTPVSAAATVTPLPQPVHTPIPYCRPSEAVVELSASTTKLAVGQTVPVTVTLTNGGSSGVHLGLIQYRLRMQPSDVLASDNLEPIDHRISLDPGQSDTVRFVLTAETPGLARLVGTTSFEIHALDYSWGSWSGCDSLPLDIIVAP